MIGKSKIVFRFFVVRLSAGHLRMTEENWNCHSDSPKARKNLKEHERKILDSSSAKNGGLRMTGKNNTVILNEAKRNEESLKDKRIIF